MVMDYHPSSYSLIILILIHPYLQAQTYIGDEIIHPLSIGLVIILESSINVL
nr:hypothetical protein [Mycoplasmopsis bovis]